MALTRKFLSALGIEADKIDEIITAHTETVDALKDEVKKYKADSEKLAETTASLETVQKELDTMKADTSTDDLKTKYSALEKEFKEYKDGIKAKEEHAKKEAAFRNALKEYGISDKRFDAIVKLSNDEIDKIEFDKDGNVKNAEEVSKAIDANWSDFKQTENTVGANVANPPANGGKPEGQPSRAKFLAEKYNREMYGIKKED